MTSVEKNRTHEIVVKKVENGKVLKRGSRTVSLYDNDDTVDEVREQIDKFFRNKDFLKTKEED